ncbi:MAG TPA: large conductance mechanosensitive channel protein MscL [Acidimicrobiia bacterium]|jgi:large conductance mechanosensitive channel
MIQEFKDFINKGNMIDLAVAFVMGVAFASVIGAFTDRIVSPLIGLIFNVDNLDGLWTFANGAGSVGAFIGAFINFVIIAFVMFLVVKAYNNMKPAVEAASTEDPEDVKLLREIRDSLKAQA